MPPTFTETICLSIFRSLRVETFGGPMKSTRGPNHWPFNGWLLDVCKIFFILQYVQFSHEWPPVSGGPRKSLPLPKINKWDSRDLQRNLDLRRHKTDYLSSNFGRPQKNYKGILGLRLLAAPWKCLPLLQKLYDLVFSESWGQRPSET